MAKIGPVRITIRLTSTTSSRCTMFLCRICFRIETSLSKLCFSFLFSLSVEISLIATTFPVSLCMAFHTIANEPEPAFCCKSQLATLLKLESLIFASIMSVSPLVGQQQQPDRRLSEVVATQRARERNMLLSGCAYSLHGASAGVYVVCVVLIIIQLTTADPVCHSSFCRGDMQLSPLHYFLWRCNCRATSAEASAVAQSRINMTTASSIIAARRCAGCSA